LQSAVLLQQPAIGVKMHFPVLTSQLLVVQVLWSWQSVATEQQSAPGGLTCSH
jgi:hypothetical protein